VTDWAIQIGRHLTPEGAVLIPPRMAAWLETNAGVTSDKRILLRGADVEAYLVMAALHVAALAHGSGIGTKHATEQRCSQDLPMWLTTAEAAEQLGGISDRAIRKRIATGRLPATKFGGRWLLNRNDVRIAQALA
jgi:excisionase family DNA binding protein